MALRVVCHGACVCCAGVCCCDLDSRDVADLCDEYSGREECSEEVESEATPVSQTKDTAAAATENRDKGATGKERRRGSSGESIRDRAINRHAKSVFVRV